jgi:YbbR domain-containing protein
MAFPDYILNNVRWKVASLVLATLIWVAINSNTQGKFNLPQTRPTSTISRPLPVTVITTATDMRTFTIAPGEVDVMLRGDERTLENLKLSEVQVFVNLIEAKDARRFVKKVLVHTPSNVELVKVTPDEVTVERVPTEPANPQSKD